MKILIGITYYRPHTSGLTIYAERLAKALAMRGHEVTVLTSQYDKQLPRYDKKDSVTIIRAPVLLRISKGVIMPTFGFLASKLVRETDVIHLHLPQFDAAGISLRGRLLNKPTVITYHCDLIMPGGLLSWLANQAVHLMNHLAAIFTHRIVTYTCDYAENSRFLRNYLKKVDVILPPVELPSVEKVVSQELKCKYNPDDRHPVIGMAARFTTEKGVEVLISALPKVFEKFPNALVQFAGPYEKIIGEEQYYKKLSPIIENFATSGQWKYLGVLGPEEMVAFYRSIDVLVIPSLNSTEAFGLVQIEAMINGVPTIASNLPGVRQPVLMHQMGKIIPIGDSEKLGDALIEVLENPKIYKKIYKTIAEKYDPDTIAEAYETMFRNLLERS